jgi:hypothetical protein
MLNLSTNLENDSLYRELATARVEELWMLRPNWW